MAIAIRRFLLRRVGKKREEKIEDYLRRISALTHAADHMFKESQEYPGTCGECGFVPDHLICEDCGESAVMHVKTYLKMIEVSGEDVAAALLGSLGFALPLSNPFDPPPAPGQRNAKYN
jgi:hypothetical protein